MADPAGRQTTPCGCPEEALIRSHVEGCPWFTAFVEAGRQTTCFCGQPDDRERVHRSNACEPWVGRDATPPPNRPDTINGVPVSTTATVWPKP